LTASGDPERTGKGGDDDGRQRGNCRFISFYKPTRASYVAIDSDAESGWVFFGGAICFFIVMTGYALLEGWRKRALNKHKQRTENNEGS
jgi:hypothetical protein